MFQRIRALLFQLSSNLRPPYHSRQTHGNDISPHPNKGLYHNKQETRLISSLNPFCKKNFNKEGSRQNELDLQFGMKSERANCIKLEAHVLKCFEMQSAI